MASKMSYGPAGHDAKFLTRTSYGILGNYIEPERTCTSEVLTELNCPRGSKYPNVEASVLLMMASGARVLGPSGC